MATPNRFFRMVFQKKNTKSTSSGDAYVKNAGPQNGDSTGDREGQARIQIGENAAFD